MQNILKKKWNMKNEAKKIKIYYYLYNLLVVRFNLKFNNEVCSLLYLLIIY